MTTRNEKFFSDKRNRNILRLNNNLPITKKEPTKKEKKEKKERVERAKSRTKAYAKLMEKLGEPTTKNNYKKQLLNSSCGSVLKINK